MTKPQHPLPPIETIAADALNEQGYLLQHKIVDVLTSASGWNIEATELPVSLPNDEETRIDIVLRQPPWRAVLECKRSAPDFKKWVFFGQTSLRQNPSASSYYLEHADLARSWNNQGDPEMMHHLKTRKASVDCPVFDYGIEVRIEPPGREKKWSATRTIEDAFQQVTVGQAGLCVRLLRARELNFGLIPIVVTTGELMSAAFSAEIVSLANGAIDPKDLTLEPREWLAVNFRIRDSVCQLSGFSANRNTDLGVDLTARQVRTIFVVQAADIENFLAWLGQMLNS